MTFIPVSKVVEEEEFIPVSRVEAKTPTPMRGTRGGSYGGPAPNPQGVIEGAGQWARENPRIIGAAGGALRGSKHGVWGAAGGAVLGGVLGEQVHQIDQLASEHPNMPKTVKDSLLRQGKAGVVSAIEEIGGGLTLKVANKVLAPFAKSVTPHAKTAIETLQQYMPKGKAAITTAEGTEHWMLDFAHNVAAKGFFGGAPMARHAHARKAAVQNMVDGLANGFGKEASPEQLGNMLTDVINGNWKAYKEEFTRPLYNRVEQLTAPTVRKIPKYETVWRGLFDANGKRVMKDVQVGVEEVVEGGIKANIKGLKTSVEGNLRHLKNIKFVGKENSGDSMVLGISKLPDAIQVDTAIALRKRLIAISDELAITNKKDPAIAIANSLTKQLDDQIELSLKSANPEALWAWREANRLYKDGAGQYNNRFLRGLLKQGDPRGGKGEPSKILSMIYAKGGIDNIKKVKAAVGQDMWNLTKGWHVREMLKKATDQKTGVIIGSRLKNNLFGYSGVGKEAMETIYTPAEINLLKNNAITLGVIQASQGGGAGGMLIQLAQAGAVIGAVAGQLPPSSVAVLAAPEVVARILTNATANKWLLGTRQIGKKGVLVGSSALRLTKIIEKIENKITNERRELSK